MNKSFQPHEAHIPYLLQLFIDYNLYGMNLINLGAVKFRRSARKGNQAALTQQTEPDRWPRNDKQRYKSLSVFEKLGVGNDHI